MHSRSITTVFALGSLAAGLTITLRAQDRLKTMPGYAEYQRLALAIPTAIKSGAISPTWSADSKSFDYTRDGKVFRYTVASRSTLEAPDLVSGASPPSGRVDAGQPERGRQFESAGSPDNAWKASYKDRNLWLSRADGTDETAITTDGSVEHRIKYGTASWVYGEELNQRTAMWWSPDSRRLAYYRFDESRVPDYYVTLNQTKRQSTVDTEAFPLAGVPNPVVDLFVYDVETKRSTKVDVRSGRPFDDAVVGHYVYHVQWTKDGRELLFLRMNRLQNIMEVVAGEGSTGATRVLLREEWPTGWVNEDPRLVFLSDGHRFIWESQRSGWNGFYLYDLTGKLLAPLTAHTAADAYSIVKVDEARGLFFYMARDGDNPLKLQLHRVGLDGRNDMRLTDPTLHHTVGNCLTSAGARVPLQSLVPGPCGISNDDRYFVDVAQTHDIPASSRLVDASTGVLVDTIAAPDERTFDDLHLRKAEMFTYTAADGKTTLRGLIQFPTTFDPSKTYPALVSVYGGPEFAANTARETFVAPAPLAEFGFLIVSLDSRAIPGLGKSTLDALYQHLGGSEMDDMAEGVKTLWNRPYFDRSRVGIFGTSYGGYTSVMELLRHPDVFAAASASSPVTDWRNYDSIYTERYMGLPQDQKAAYDAGSAMTYVKNLKGRLLLYYGTADNNVHPANSLQLIQALQNAGKSFDLQVGPDRGHTGVNQDRMMEFFIDALRP
ncbi:MAG TPA: DPP IV N-terminal domain-containing protein [Vicinamibacterales bacterium]|nr:DPP IV N-terminal domain-containing protein [Vicinamibacterales bacterium]